MFATDGFSECFVEVATRVWGREVVILFGDLHIEMGTLKALGDWL